MKLSGIRQESTESYHRASWELSRAEVKLILSGPSLSGEEWNVTGQSSPASPSRCPQKTRCVPHSVVTSSRPWCSQAADCSQKGFTHSLLLPLKFRHIPQLSSPRESLPTLSKQVNSTKTTFRTVGLGWGVHVHACMHACLSVYLCQGVV